MTTANKMIERAMRLIGATGQGEVPTNDEYSDGLNAMNAMLEAWSIDRLLVYEIVKENFTWPIGKNTVTIGPGGDFDTQRPVKMSDGFSRIANIDYPYRLVDRRAYDDITDKTTKTNYPNVIYYDPIYPVGTLAAYPVPDSNLDVHIRSWKQLQQFTDGTVELSLPPGYQRAIEFNLAVEISPEFQMNIPPLVLAMSSKTLTLVKKLNKPSMVAKLDPAIAPAARYNIYRD